MRTLVLAAALLSVAQAFSQGKLETVFSSSLIINGPTTSPDGRLFTAAQPQAPATTPQVVEIVAGKPVPYPDAQWNSWKPGMDGSHLFVGVNAIRFGPDGALWVVDRGAPGIGKPLVPSGPKLIRFDVSTNTATRIYPLAAVARPWTFVDDIRFNGSNAYLTDAGSPGLIVLDLHTGKGRRVLGGHPSTVAQSPLVADGKPLRDKQGHPVNIHADQLEVSPDGKWFYFQPASGILSRIETRFLDDPAITEEQLASHVERFAETPSTGGTAIAADGTIYSSDVDRNRILAISPTGQISVLLQDPRLVWVDAMWIDNNGNLLIPAAQLNRTAGLNDGKDAVQQPVSLYRLHIGKEPVRR